LTTLELIEDWSRTTILAILTVTPQVCVTHKTIYNLPDNFELPQYCNVNMELEHQLSKQKGCAI